MKLNSLYISGFRAFNRLEISNLTGVNLIVGMNNVGKTTILEALRLYLSDDNWIRMADILLAREEISLKKRRRDPPGTLEVVPLSFESLFYGRPPLETFPSFQVGPMDGPRLEVEFSWLRRIEDEANASVRYVRAPDGDPDLDPDIMPGFVVELETQALIPLDRLQRFARRRLRPETNVVYLPSWGMAASEMGRIWDGVALTVDEDIVVSTLKAIFPNLERIGLVQSPQRTSDRILLVKLSEFPEPVPFKSLGEGVVHLFGIILGLFSARNGVLLIDEIENGIHFSVQAEMWKIILDRAAQWNVQVFATTHSWDCVSGLHEATAGNNDSDASLLRIERKADRFNVVEFSSEELSIAHREFIEVR